MALHYNSWDNLFLSSFNPSTYNQISFHFFLVCLLLISWDLVLGNDYENFWKMNAISWQIVDEFTLLLTADRCLTNRLMGIEGDVVSCLYEIVLLFGSLSSRIPLKQLSLSYRFLQTFIITFRCDSSNNCWNDNRLRVAHEWLSTCRYQESFIDTLVWFLTSQHSSFLQDFIQRFVDGVLGRFLSLSAVVVIRTKKARDVSYGHWAVTNRL